LATLVVRLVSQPLPTMLSQLAKPRLQVTVHTRLVQAPEPLAGAVGHTVPQVPQLALSLVGLTQVLLHTMSGDEHTLRQAPAKQMALEAQRLPQAPQLLRSSVVGVSQPLEAMPSQLPKPAVHDARVQAPLVQAGLPLANVQVRPQVPQLVTVLVRLVSQPLLSSPSQLPKPVLQVMPQAPAVQVAAALARVGQAVPQAPQLVALVRVSTSQPLLLLLSQLAKPSLQRRPQVPIAQAAAALAPPAQTVPQAPQLAAEVAVSTSQPLAALLSQLAKPVLQVATAQAPIAQLDVALARAQARPQAPQWETLPARLDSQPLPGLPSQSPKPPAQLATPHAPPEQVCDAVLARRHTLPQAPQWFVLVLVATSQPSAGLTLQLPKPLLHAAMVQLPPAQALVALLSRHVLPHAPQWAASLARLTSQPSVALPLQSAKPERHAATVQRPAKQAPAALPGAHTLPHAPQWLASVRVSTSQPLAGLPSQSAKPSLQRATAQRPPAQALVALARAQAEPHAPQWAVLVWVSVSQPLPVLPSQSPRPWAQVPSPHTPSRQAGVPPMVVQAVLQVPQCDTSLRVLTSQPLSALPSQSANPSAQRATVQRPAVHIPVALAGAHARPQPPQCWALVRWSTSQPSVSSALQS
jgi:hypothetical protein